MIMKSLIAGAALALLGAVLPLQSAIIVSLEADAPDSSKILSTFTGPSTGNIAWHHTSSSNRRNVAFAFQIKDAGLLHEIGVYVSSSKGGGDLGFSLTLRKNTTVPTTITGGTLVGTFAGQIDVAETAGILKFNLGEDFSVEAGEYYTVVLTWTGDTNAAKHFNVLHGADDSTISAGSWDATDGGSWVRRDSRDYLFYAAGTQAIPEPSTALLLGIPVIALGLYRRHRSGVPRP